MAVQALRDTPVQRFKPTSGTFVGVAGLVVTLGLIGFVAMSEPDLRGLQICLGLGIAAVLIWMTLLRPRVTAYEEALLLRNAATDVEVPFAAIDAAVVRHTLNVWVGERRYMCAAIGRTSRSMLKRGRPGPSAALGLGMSGDKMSSDQSAGIGAGSDYPTYVEQRIEDLARAARQVSAADATPVRRSWAVLELGALAVLGVLLAVSLLV
jgi:hypothetical protein